MKGSESMDFLNIFFKGTAGSVSTKIAWIENQ
jgi:hypothetical protein